MDLERFAKRLTKDMNALVAGAGKVVYAVAYEPAKGGGWAVIFDTEYAALKAFYAWRNFANVHFGKGSRGWYVSKSQQGN
jgi:hypothetical protein